MVGIEWFMAFWLILTPTGKVVGKLGYPTQATYEDCKDLLSHHDEYEATVQLVSPGFTLDRGHCDPVRKQDV